MLLCLSVPLTSALWVLCQIRTAPQPDSRQQPCINSLQHTSMETLNAFQDCLAATAVRPPVSTSLLHQAQQDQQQQQRWSQPQPGLMVISRTNSSCRWCPPQHHSHPGLQRYQRLLVLVRPTVTSTSTNCLQGHPGACSPWHGRVLMCCWATVVSDACGCVCRCLLLDLVRAYKEGRVAGHVPGLHERHAVLQQLLTGSSSSCCCCCLANPTPSIAHCRIQRHMWQGPDSIQHKHTSAQQHDHILHNLEA